MRNNMGLRVQEEQIICPISLDVMADPVVAEDGITYDRAYIAAWFATHNTSPVTRAVIGNALIPNIAARYYCRICCGSSEFSTSSCRPSTK